MPTVSVSISYLLSGGLLLGLGQFWRTQNESKRRMHDRMASMDSERGTLKTAVAVLETKVEAQDGDLVEIKRDIKSILGILGNRPP